MSFQDFIQLIPTTLQNPLNQVALDYWHDYQSGRPIDGGVAFESILRKINLDGSLASLAVLDKFLDKAKPHLADNAVLLSQKIDQRNLLTFIAFYTGLVLVFHAHSSEFHNCNDLTPSVNWVSFEQLCQTFAPLHRLINDDFSYSIAVSLLPLTEHKGFVPATISDSVFFPLVTIIERLYPQRQNSLISTAPNFGYVSDSLFDSVRQMLQRWQTVSLQPVEVIFPTEITDTDKAVQPTLPDTIIATLPASLLSDLDNPLMERKDWQTVSEPPTIGSPVVTHFTFDIPDFSGLSMATDMADDTPDLTLNQAETSNLAKNPLPTTPNETANHPTVIAELPVTTETSDNSPAKPTVKKSHQKLDTRSLSGREAIKLAKAQAKQLAREQAEKEAQLAKEAEAKRQAEIAEALANPRINEKLLNQRKSLIDEKPAVKDSFSELESDLQTPILPDSMAENIKVIYEQAITISQSPQDTAQAQKTVAVVQKLANANMTDAMLHLALWQLRGRTDLGIEKNIEQGIEWVKKSAQLQDNRAEKLLSKLYFSGEIVGLDSELGKYWLAQASAHGHVEAQRLQQSFVMVNTLKETRQDETSYLTKLAIGTGILVVLALIIIFAIKI